MYLTICRLWNMIAAGYCFGLRLPLFGTGSCRNGHPPQELGKRKISGRPFFYSGFMLRVSLPLRQPARLRPGSQGRKSLLGSVHTWR